MVRAGTKGRAAPRLRRITAVTIVALVAMAILVSAAVVVLTTGLHEANVALRQTVASVRIARDAQVRLLARELAKDPATRAERERDLRRTLAELEAQDSLQSDTLVQRDTRAARASVERYLAATQDAASSPGADLRPAMDGLEEVVRADVLAADRTIARGARLDVLGDAVGLAAAVVMIAILAFLAYWIRGSVVHPTLALSAVVERFREGDFSVRATPAGAAELRVVTQELNAMADAIAERRKARLTHLAGVAHDLRNPLAALKMSSVFVDPARPPRSEQDTRRALEVIHRQVGRLERMVDDLLDAARIEAGQLSLALEERDLRDSVREVVELFRDTSKRHDLTIDVPDEPLLVRCDPVRIEQTLVNLVSNAIKYSPRGGTVRIVGRRERGVASVSVSDEGIGIRDSDLPSIWAPFRRTGVSSEGIPGVGLGLWTSKRIVEAHEGTLIAKSTLGRGSTFTLSLPLAGQPEVSPPEKAERGEPSAVAPTLIGPRTRHG